MDAILYVAVGAGLVLLVYSVAVLRRRSRGTDDPVRRHENYLQRGEGDASARQAEGRRTWGDHG
jgi:hypothetical protein